MILVSMCPNERKSGNVFDDAGINMCIQKSLEPYLMILVSIKTHTKKSVNI